MIEIELTTTDLHKVSEDKRAALGYVVEAFVEGQLDGLDAACLAEAAIVTAFQELVAAHGEEAAARFAESLPGRVRDGVFSTAARH